MKLDALVIPIEHDATHFMMGMSLVEKVALATVATIAGAFAGLAAFGIKAAMEAARVNELAIVNQVLARNANLAGEAVKQEAEEVRHMGIEAAASQQIVAYFIKAHLDLAKASDLARVAQDAAVISAKNSTEAAQDMIWGITTLNIRVLRNAGINITAAEAYEHYAKATGKSVKSLTALEKQQAFLNEVLLKGKDIAGAYTAAMTSPAKVLRSFPRFINDIFVAVGRYLTPAMSTFVFSIASFLKELGTQVSEGGTLAPGLAKIGVILRDMLGTALSFLTNIDWDMLGTKLTGIADAFGRIWLGTKKMILTGELPSIQDIVTWLDNVDSAMAEAINSKDWKATGDAFGNMVASVLTGGVESKKSEVVPAIGKAISDFLLGAMGYVSWQSVWDTFSSAWKKGWIQIGWDTKVAFGQFGINLTNGIISITTSIQTTINNKLREISKVWYDRVYGWINQAVLSLTNAEGMLYDKLQEIVDKIRGMLAHIGINIPITVSTNTNSGGSNRPTVTSGGGGHGRASGGAVMAGQVYKVNELGKPEYFIPTMNGRVENKSSNQPTIARIDRRDMEMLADMIVERALRAA